MKIIDKRGNETLLERTKTAFICSRNTPEKLEYLVGKWILGLKPETDCIMCGNQSPMEKAVFTTLLQRKIPVILALAEAMPDRFGADVEEALREERLLVVTHCDASVHFVTARSAFDRNILMLSMSQKIVVGYCTKGGNLERALAGFENVEYLENGQPWLGGHDDGQPKPPDEVGNRVQRMSDKAIWSRTIRLSSGTFFLDFMTNGADKLFKITHSTGTGDGRYSRETLCFDRKELAEFSRVTDGVAVRAGKGEPLTPEMAVKSLSGDVSYGTVSDGGYDYLYITQVKTLVDGTCRRNTVKLLVGELGLLVNGINEALTVWKK